MARPSFHALAASDESEMERPGLSVMYAISVTGVAIVLAILEEFLGQVL